MKRCFSVVLVQCVVALCATTIFAQSNWNFVNPRPQGGDLYGLTIKKDSLAVVAGDKGVTIRRVGGKFLTPIFVGAERLLSATRFVDTLWAVGDSAAIYRSIDNGATWSNKSLSGKNYSFWSVAAYNAQRIVVVGDSGYAYMTTDAGASWIKQTNTLHVRMTGLKLDSITGYAVTTDGHLVVGNNLGAFGWVSETIASGQSLNDLALNHFDMWIVGNSGYLQHRYTLANSIIWDTNFTSLGAPLKSVLFTGQYVVAVGGSGAIVRSSDAGNTWTLPSSGTTEDLNRVDSTTDSTHLGTLLAVGHAGVILKSTDYGLTWLRLDSGSRAQVLALTQSPNGNYYGSSNLGGLFSSKDLGLTWRRDSITGTYNQLTDIQFSRTGFGLISTTGAGVLVTLDSGKTWVSKAIPNTTILGISITMDSIGMAVGANGAIYRSTNKGSTWTSVSSPVVKNFYDVDMFGKFGAIVGYGGASLYTTNAGASWSAGSTAATAQLNRVRMATAMTGIAVGVVGNIWRTTDGGQHWTSITSPSNLTLRDVAFHDDVNGMIAGDAGTILKTTNGGTSWSVDNSHITQNLYGAMIASGTTAFVGGNQGTILMTSNSLLPVELVSLSGERISEHRAVINWSVTAQTDNAGFSIERKTAAGEFVEIGWSPVAQSNASDATFSYEDYAAPTQQSTYRLTQRDLNGAEHHLGEVTIETWQSALPQSNSSLYPNPATDHAFVNFYAKTSGTVVIVISDLLGRELRRMNYTANAGANLYQMDLSGLSVGSYHAIVTSAAERCELPLVLVR